MRDKFEMILLTTSLRSFYDADNPVGKLLDELIVDLNDGVSRNEIKKDAKKLLKGLPREASAYAVISEIIERKNS